MKRYFIYAVVLLSGNNCYSQSIFDAATIAAGLKENAHSVKRLEKINFEVKDIDEATYTVQQVITVLDAEGEDQLYFKQYSDQFKKLDNAEIKVFDAKGAPVNKYKMKEMKTQGTGDGLVIDGKITYFRVAAPSYPVTVQFDYVIKYKGTLNYPDYEITEPDQSVEYSVYTATVPADMDLRFKAKNISLMPSIKESGKHKTYSWEIKNLPASVYEEGAVSYESSYPSVLVAPSKFSMDGNKGDLTTWKDFGSWYITLSTGSINLSDESKATLNKMVQGASGDKEKIKIIYRYLQQNFRYVSIQLGIGGFKPFNAKFVDQKKYGDCKALSNYMQACLDAVGIVSFPP